MTGPLRLGTRASTLAMTQSGQVARAVSSLAGVEVELVAVTTHGDVSRESLSSMGGTGVFASALREALLAGECDFVVHSMKDLPTGAHPGLFIAAVPTREDARDALCARDGLTLRTLPAGATVGTGSPRRRAQVLAHRPDLSVVDIRGNVETRLRTVERGELDAVILAAAGLSRIGRTASITEYLPLVDWPTAAGQGALAVEARESDRGSEVCEVLARVDDENSRLTAMAERAVLGGLEAGCAAPIGVSATLAGDQFTLRAAVHRTDGSEQLRRETSLTFGARASGADRAALAGRSAAELVSALLDAGAADLAPLANHEGTVSP